MKLPSFHNLQTGLLISVFLVVTGCAAALIGVGAGIGTVAYVNGKLLKTYKSEYHKTVQASVTTLENLRIPVNEQTSDELKTSIKATRPDGTPVTIDIVRIEENLTEVGVRVGSIGLLDYKVSSQIHNMIKDNLDKASAGAKSPQFMEDRTSKNSIKSSAESENKAAPQKSDNQENTRKQPLVQDDDFIIFFNHNSNEISEEQIEKLDKAAQRILKLSNAKVILNGYTDAGGDVNYNIMISKSRAAAVKAYLVGKGVKPEAIEIVGHGAKNFISDNNTIEGRNRNRRVEIVISQ